MYIFKHSKVLHYFGTFLLNMPNACLIFRVVFPRSRTRRDSGLVLCFVLTVLSFR